MRNIEAQLEKRININMPSLLILDGGQGQGKTTLMYHIISYINKLKGLPPPTLGVKDHPQIALGGKEFNKFFNICKAEKLPVIGYDEAGDFSRRGSISRFNAMINRRFETFRSSNIIVILCLPNFNILDNHLFDLQVPRLLLHLRDRELTQKWGHYEGYSLVAMNWIRFWYSKITPAIRYKCYSKVQPNFHGNFLDLPAEKREQLKKLSDFGKDRESQQAEIKAEGLLNYSDLAGKVGRSVVWTRYAIKRLKIKPARTINRFKYYSKETADLLVDHLEKIHNKEYED